MDNLHKSEYVIAFKTTNHAIKAEYILLQAGLNITVMPLPPQIMVGCGICLRVSKSNVNQALQILYDNCIAEIEIYEKEWDNEKYKYTKTKL